MINVSKMLHDAHIVELSVQDVGALMSKEHAYAAKTSQHIGGCSLLVNLATLTSLATGLMRAQVPLRCCVCLHGLSTSVADHLLTHDPDTIGGGHVCIAEVVLVHLSLCTPNNEGTCFLRMQGIIMCAEGHS